MQTGGSSRGVNDTRNGSNDVGMVSRPLKDDEKDLHAFAVATDGVSIILHKNNPVASIDFAPRWSRFTPGKSPTGIMSAVTTRPSPWSTRPRVDPTLELFLHYFKLKNSDIKADVVIGDNEQGIKTVAGNPNAIGYVSIGTAEYDIEHGQPIKLLPIGGVPATSANVANGKFPLSRPLNLVTKAPPQGLVKEFIEFAQSPRVHDLVREQSFVPLDR